MALFTRRRGTEEQLAFFKCLTVVSHMSFYLILKAILVNCSSYPHSFKC